MDAFQILVIVLAAALALFLIVGIVAFMYLVKILRHIQNITQKAENMADYAESASKTILTSVSPAIIARAIFKQIKKSMRK